MLQTWSNRGTLIRSKYIILDEINKLISNEQKNKQEMRIYRDL